MAPAQLPLNFTHGEVLRWRKVGGLTLAEVQYQPGQRVHRHVHPHARFVLVLAGSITEIRGDDTQTYGSSTLLFRRGAEPHAYMVGRAGATCLIVDVDAEWQARARLHAPVLEQSAAFRGGFVLHLAHRLHGEFRLRDEVSRLAIESITLGVLAEASRRDAKGSERPAPGWLQQARALVDTHFARPLPLVEVAKHVGVHPVHLARTFRRVHRITFAGTCGTCASSSPAVSWKRRPRRSATSRRQRGSAIKAISPACSSATPDKRPRNTVSRSRYAKAVPSR